MSEHPLCRTCYALSLSDEAFERLEALDRWENEGGRWLS